MTGLVGWQAGRSSTSIQGCGHATTAWAPLELVVLAPNVNWRACVPSSEEGPHDRGWKPPPTHPSHPFPPCRDYLLLLLQFHFVTVQ